MRSIYQKIIVVLVGGFIIQATLVGFFYKQVVIKKLINQVNYQVDRSESVLQEAIQLVQTNLKNKVKLSKAMDKLSVKYKTNFVISNLEGDTIYSSPTKGTTNNNRIEKVGYISNGTKTVYMIKGYFPSTVTYKEFQKKEQRNQVITIILLFICSLATLYFIYAILTYPIRKLSKAVTSLDYGNTVVKIPYYGEDELGMLCRNFEEMGERLRASDQSQQEIIQAVSHDIKTPLTSIIGYSKRLLEGKVKEERLNEYYEIINRKSNDLKVLLEELEDYTLNNRKIKLEKEIINCNDFSTTIIDNLKVEIEERGGKFEYHFNLTNNCKINVDSKKIKRVFENITSNSFKYAGESCLISMSVTEKENLLYFQISDDGPGVDETQLKKIFDRFYRVDSSRSRDKGGTGLGLAICKDIIENHGGEIGAESSAGSGLTIWYCWRTDD